jgi:hypothetical protein
VRLGMRCALWCIFSNSALRLGAIHRSVLASIRLPHRATIKRGISKFDPALNQDSAGRKGLYQKSNELWMTRPNSEFSNEFACDLFKASPCGQVGKHVVYMHGDRTGYCSHGAFDSYVAHGLIRLPSREKVNTNVCPFGAMRFEFQAGEALAPRHRPVRPLSPPRASARKPRAAARRNRAHRRISVGIGRSPLR